MTKFNFILIAITLTFSGCKNQKEDTKVWNIDIQGHRGARGLLPENTIEGFLLALDHGVTTLELDLAVTSDRLLVVSHEPWMSAAICLTPTGDTIPHSDERKYNIFEMTYSEVRQFDCGSMGNQRFPQQQPLAIFKPLLSDVFTSVEAYCLNKNLDPKPRYNIEIKSMPQGDSLFHPSPPEFSDLVYKLVSQSIPWQRVNIQSFDFRVLQYFHDTYPDVKLAVLIENEATIEQNLATLGFTPSIYSCWYKLLKQEDVARLQEMGMKVIPWTVNELADMQQLVDWGVDGIITDYPDRAKQLKK